MRKSTQGFTLIELVIVITLLGLMSVSISKILIQGLTTIKTQQDIIDGIAQGNLTLERMAREMRQVRTSSDVTTMTASTFAFINLAGTSISYTLSGNTLTRNGDTLATGINSLTFAYFDINNGTVATATNLAYVTINMNVTKNTTNYVLNTGLYLRDLT